MNTLKLKVIGNPEAAAKAMNTTTELKLGQELIIQGGDAAIQFQADHNDLFELIELQKDARPETNKMLRKTASTKAK